MPLLPDTETPDIEDPSPTVAMQLLGLQADLCVAQPWTWDQQAFQNSASHPLTDGREPEEVGPLSLSFVHERPRSLHGCGQSCASYRPPTLMSVLKLVILPQPAVSRW